MDKVAVSEDAKSIVKSFYELGAQGDITSFAPRLADDFEPFVPPYPRSCAPAAQGVGGSRGVVISITLSTLLSYPRSFRPSISPACATSV
jgi:hypothetical protein